MQKKEPKKKPKNETGIVWKSSATGNWLPYVRVGQDWFTPPQPTITSARMWRDKMRYEKRERRLLPEHYRLRGGHTVQQCIDRYLPTVTHKLTAKEEHNFATWWGKWYEGRKLAAITPGNLEEARLALRAGQWSRYPHKPHPRSEARVNRYMQWLHQMLDSPVNKELLPHGNPVRKIKKYGEYVPPFQIIRESQEAALLDVLAVKRPDAVPLVRLAILTGMRMGEQFKCRKADVNLAESHIVIPRPKSPNKKIKKPRSVVLNEEAKAIVATLMQTPGPWLIPHPKHPERRFAFGAFYVWHYRPALKAVGLPAQVTWHSLRHTWATRFLRYGLGTLRDLQIAGGWSSLKMVERYTSTDTERILEILNRMAPLSLKSEIKVRLDNGVIQENIVSY